MHVKTVVAVVGTLIFTVIFSCEQPVEPLSGDAALPLGKAAQQSEEVFTVEPTGGDDTENIKAALSAAQAAGEGSVIYFAPGHFHTDYLILTDFVGTIKGAGMDQTIISPIPKLDFGDGPFEYDFPTYENPWPNFITFIRGNITISDLTLYVEDPAPVIPYTLYGYEEVVLAYLIRFTGDDCSSRVERVHFKGSEQPNPETGTANIAYANYYAGEIYGRGGNRMAVRGDHYVESSVFEDVIMGIGAMLSDSKLIIGGKPQLGNLFTNTAVGIFINSLRETGVVVSYNEINSYILPLRLWQGYTNEMYDDVEDPKIPRDGYVHVKRNTIHNSGTWNAIYIRDMVRVDQIKRLSILIENNRVLSESPSAAMVIDGCFGGTVKNNIFQGSGNGAIFAFSQTKDMLFLGNNLNQFESRYTPYYFGQQTSNNTLVGGNLKENVINNGTNNKIVGVNTQQGNPPGPS
ncbi:MAG: hypothetical protein GF372_12990, partial [Candidatus Marinimicrobia bacterium]|nr:hypothetical protein [Candidatus Neomarinimicrobiota bacterium]